MRKTQHIIAAKRHRGRRVRDLIMCCGGVVLLSCAAARSEASWLDQALGLRDLSWSDADAALGWEHPLPPWAWASIVIGAAVFAGWSYSRLLGPRPVRLLLAAFRALLLVGIAVLLAGPTLVDPREREEPDALVVLVDRSASMRIGDVEAGGGVAGGAITRDEAMRRALAAQAGVFGPEGLGAKSRRVVWMGFNDRAFEMGPPTNDGRFTASVEGGTQLRAALDQAVRAAGGSPIAGIVLLSDGRSGQLTGADVVRQLAGRGARVYAVPLGASEPPLDLAIARVEAPEQAFAEDVVPVSVQLEARGGEALDPRAVRVRLVDAVTNQVLDEATPPAEDAGLREAVRLEARSEEVGRRKLRVEVEYVGNPGDADPGEAAGAASPGVELVTSNNTRELEVEIIDRPIRVLYVEGYPRWEYRYLKNTLIREESIDSSMLLLSADRAFAQEGDSPITRFPTTVEEMRPYDIVVIGDVPPSYFTPGQLTLIRDHVVNGGGLLWIGGSRQTPTGWTGTALEDLLPMRSATGVASAVGAAGVEVEPTPLAERLNVLNLRGPRAGSPGSSNPDTRVPEPGAEGGWPEELPALRWAQDLGVLKPTAEAIAQGTVEGVAEPVPLLVRLRYGAGQVLYLATDETWRWRYGRGELYFDQFWVQLVRLLGRGRLEAGALGERARLVVSERQVDVDEPVVVELVVDDPALVERTPGSVGVTVVSTPGSAAASTQAAEVALDRMELRPVGSGDMPAEGGTPGGRRVYRAVWRPGAGVAGPLVLRVTEPALAELGLSQAVEVVTADDELRHVEPDHARLAALAEGTGGQVVPLDELSRLVSAVPNLAEKVATDEREPLWHSWLAFGFVILLLTTEWVVRKMVWLV